MGCGLNKSTPTSSAANIPARYFEADDFCWRLLRRKFSLNEERKENLILYSSYITANWRTFAILYFPQIFFAVCRNFWVHCLSCLLRRLCQQMIFIGSNKPATLFARLATDWLIAIGARNISVRNSLNFSTVLDTLST